MRKRYHLCISVRGVLQQSNREIKRNWSGAITLDNGKVLTSADEIRNLFMDELAQGHEVIPVGTECDNFDYKHGCKGHIMEGEHDDLD